MDRGPLKKHQRKPADQRIRTVDVYTDGKGVKRYKGNRNLRPSEILDCKPSNYFARVYFIGLWIWIHEMVSQYMVRC